MYIFGWTITLSNSVNKEHFWESEWLPIILLLICWRNKVWTWFQWYHSFVLLLFWWCCEQNFDWFWKLYLYCYFYSYPLWCEEAFSVWTLLCNLGVHQTSRRKPTFSTTECSSIPGSCEALAIHCRVCVQWKVQRNVFNVLHKCSHLIPVSLGCFMVKRDHFTHRNQFVY